ncbi:MAG: aminoacyl-tRNA hydrolase [Methyloligellaceae bacterium]
MKLLVGLGNPGAKYAGNRHNIGFMAVDEIIRIHGFSPWKKRFQSASAEGQIGNHKCLILKPGTYMNESGRAVGEAARFYKIEPENIIVFHDELDLAPGKLKVKSGGGNAGHNGLKSISAHVGNDYVRVRMGIGHPGRKDIVHIYVLQDFAKADKDWLEPQIDAVARSIPELIDGNSAGFLSDVAKQINPNISNNKPKQNQNEAKNRDKAKADSSKPAKKSDEAENSSSLAEQLKNWRSDQDS